MKLIQLVEGRGWAADMARENRERQRKEREQAKADEKARKITSRTNEKSYKESLRSVLYAKLSRAISQAFPDGDPMDLIYHWMEHNKLSMADVDKEFKKHHQVGYNQYMRRMWNDWADQAIYDAEIEFEHLKPRRTKDKVIKDVLIAVKNSKYVLAQLIMDRSRHDGNDYPEFQAVEKSIGHHRVDTLSGEIPQSNFFDYNVKTGKFTKLPNPY